MFATFAGVCLGSAATWPQNLCNLVQLDKESFHRTDEFTGAMRRHGQYLAPPAPVRGRPRQQREAGPEAEGEAEPLIHSGSPTRSVLQLRRSLLVAGRIGVRRQFATRRRLARSTDVEIGGRMPCGEQPWVLGTISGGRSPYPIGRVGA